MQIDLGILTQNARALKQSLTPGTRLLAAVKANAYGHGLVPAARAFLAGGADMLGVAIAQEGAALREAGIRADILIFGPTNAQEARMAVAHDLIQAAYSIPCTRWMEQAAGEVGRTARVHIKVETGMNRIGTRAGEPLRLLLGELAACQSIRAEGIFTHLAESVGDAAYTNAQKSRFEQAVGQARAVFGDLLVHAANSGAALLRPDMHYGMVRGGIALYGYPPCRTQVALRPALSLHTSVALLHEVPAGETVGYGRGFTAHRDTLVATLPIGYGDGYLRAIGGRGCVLLGGKRAPVIGRVCMDQCMVDATGIPAKVGDPVVLLGTMGKERIDAEEIAAWCDTISYEILLLPSTRVPRRYV